MRADSPAGSGWQRYFLSGLGIGDSIVLGRLLWRGVAQRLEAAAYTLIVAGALGNVADWIARSFVVDYLDLYWRNWHWPAFNRADTAITFGALLLIVSAFRHSVPVTASSSRCVSWPGRRTQIRSPCPIPSSRI
jgi:lipoprotein signal peptidase